MRRLLRFFFYLIYQPLARSYDLVAWTVSLGRWEDWVACALSYCRGPRLLELGHGPGHLLVKLAKRGIQVFGLDFSAQMSHLAARRLSKYGYAKLVARGIAQALPFPGQSFDTLIATFPSEYILHPETLSEARRVLHPGGRLVVLPLAWITSSAPLDRLARWLFTITGEAPAWQERWLGPFLAAGFTHTHLERVELRGSQVLILVFENPLSD